MQAKGPIRARFIVMGGSKYFCLRYFSHDQYSRAVYKPYVYKRGCSQILSTIVKRTVYDVDGYEVRCASLVVFRVSEFVLISLPTFQHLIKLLILCDYFAILFILFHYKIK